MCRLLNDVGFAFRKRKCNCVLLERDDIIVWRWKYTWTIGEMRKEKRSRGVLLPTTHRALSGVEELLNQAIALVTPDNWARDRAHVECLEAAWERDGAIDTTFDSIIISLGSGSSSFSASSVSEVSGVEELCIVRNDRTPVWCSSKRPKRAGVGIEPRIREFRCVSSPLFVLRAEERVGYPYPLKPA
ncbi:hypothetical protein HPB50_005921 [Hyalomma asiaticum]|uniref:Uncharacterized protein n=1 Tax=Hyalomma asiaticum TaxID=266040 RepID=A0ACB7T793_HYAAI|nr:hypothetical protein HPB50_005921 [Hyalomma asiaticum]